MEPAKTTTRSALYLVPTENGNKRSRINGRALRHRKLDARQLACLGMQAKFGEKQANLSDRQIAEAFGVSVSYLAIAAALSSEKREAIASGADQTSFTLLKKVIKQPQPAKAVG